MLVSPGRADGRGQGRLRDLGTGALLVLGRLSQSSWAETTTGLSEGRQEGAHAVSLCMRKGFSWVTWIRFYFHPYCFIRYPPGSERRSRPGDRDGNWLGTYLGGMLDSFFLVTKSQGKIYFVDKICSYRTKTTSNWEEAYFIKSVKLFSCVCPLAGKDKKGYYQINFSKKLPQNRDRAGYSHLLLPPKAARHFFHLKRVIRKMVSHSAAVALYLSGFHYISTSSYSSKIW